MYDKFNVAHYGLRGSSSNHSIFVRHSSTSTIILKVYVDIVTGDDHQGIIQLKVYLNSHFHIKGLGLFWYFLEIEVACSPKCLSLSQRKYFANFLKETGTLGFKPIDTPMDPNICFDQNLKKPLAYPEKYMISKLIYLTVTRPDIIFAMGVLSRYM